jgi:N-acetylglucosaminyldiphosphoundecaprenol N-acetyl-beta-D-mannosaminyltransferase
MLQQKTELPTVELFGIKIDAISMETAVQRIYEWIEQRDGNCRYVVTPNVDHLVQLRDNERFQATYCDASLVVADGFPLVLASRLFRKPIPQRVAGSDLVPALFAAADPERPTKVYLLGAAPGVAERAAREIESTWPAVTVSGLHSPPLGFEVDEEENEAILDKLQEAAPDVVIVGLGAPKQELWVHKHRRRINAPVALCAGATIDFLAGERRRAPRWVRKSGLEWCHRMLSDPRRLVRRYVYDAWVLPQLIWNEWRRRDKS